MILPVYYGDLSYSTVSWHTTNCAATSHSCTAALFHLSDNGEATRSCCLTERQQQLLPHCRHWAACLGKGWECYSSTVSVGVWKELGALGSLSSFSVPAWSRGSCLTAEEQWLWGCDSIGRGQSGLGALPHLGMQLVFWRSSLMSIQPEWMDIFSLKAVWWTRCLQNPLSLMI